MLPTLSPPGIHPFFFEGPAGVLEAELAVPPNFRSSYVALLGHPHSLQGGTMTNKVVTTLARGFAELGIPSIRFNFRGVGRSAGVYDAGKGESLDMLELARLWMKEHPTSQCIFAGFSFGSYVSCLAASQSEAAMVLSIAPPVNHFDFDNMSSLAPRWYILQGDEDEVVPLEAVLAFAAGFTPALSVQRFKDTGHFFHGKLLLLREAIITLTTENLLPL